MDAIAKEVRIATVEEFTEIKAVTFPCHLITNSDNPVNNGLYILHAVTQDVKIGDEVYREAEGEDIEPSIANEKHLGWNKEVKEEGIGKPYYKILGPLSPHATWVKDGEKIKIADSWGNMDEEMRKEFLKLIGPITVLGPCGHSH